MEPNERLRTIRRLMQEADDCHNDFPMAVEGWEWWQEQCEHLVAEVAALDSWLSTGGAAPEAWAAVRPRQR